MRQQAEFGEGRGGIGRLFRRLGLSGRRPGSVRLASRSYRYLARRLAHDHGTLEEGALVVMSGACPAGVVVENAMMLAAALAAEVKARVLLVDGDLRDGVLTARFGLGDAPGLVDAIGQDDAPADPVPDPAPDPVPVHTTARDGVWVLPLGASGRIPPEAHDRLPAVVAELRTRFDFVLLVQGEAGSDTRYLSFARGANTVLLVAEEGTTRIAQIEEAEALFTIHDVDHVRLLLSETVGHGSPSGR